MCQSSRCTKQLGIANLKENVGRNKCCYLNAVLTFSSVLIPIELTVLWKECSTIFDQIDVSIELSYELHFDIIVFILHVKYNFIAPINW